ncbi:MAG: TIGR02710 family CRISPR-associated CARF protein [bacterium]|nr:TIGR02710 family CRISPR-associated CARF protein [Candidatus Sumerlaeota bacterium]
MTSALICTVGMTFSPQNDIVDALVDEITAFNPALVLFLISRESRENALKIAQRCNLAADAYEFIELESIHNLNDIFQTTNKAIRSLHARGFSNQQISLNYTSGTKVMGSGAVLSAIFNQCQELRYIYEGRGGDRVVKTHPSAVFAYRDLLVSQKLIEEMRFRSATDTLDTIDTSLLSEYDVQTVVALRAIADAYYYWDNFHHKQFVEIMKSLPPDIERAARFLVGDNVLDLVTGIGQICETCEYTPALFADMMNNALRRKLEGQLDDAMTRMYRVLEMLAQWVLRRADIDTDDLDTRRVPPRYRVNYEAMRSMDDGQVRIGLRKSYELLALMKTPLGLRFRSYDELGRMLHERRNSILAHGTQPVKEEDCANLLAAVRELFRSEVPDFDNLCHTLQFPWLKERVS